MDIRVFLPFAELGTFSGVFYSGACAAGFFPKTTQPDCVLPRHDLRDA